LLATMISLLET